MKKRLILLTILTFANATGPSSALIKLTPIATNSDTGAVLIRTYRNISPLGGDSLDNERYGWLVVSARETIWDERIALRGDEQDPKSQKRLDAYKEAKVNLAHPDKVLRSMMHKYHFTKNSKLTNKRFHSLELKPKQSCYRSKCIDSVLPLRTIEKHKSQKIVASTMGNFSFQGVVIVPSQMNRLEENKTANYGAVYTHFKNKKNVKEIGYEMIDIESVVLVDAKMFI